MGQEKNVILKVTAMCLTIFLMVPEAFCQNISDYADKFDNVFINYPLINPASTGTYQERELYTGYRALTGLFSEVNAFYTHINATLGRNAQGRNKNVVGLTLFSDREGEFFSRSRAWLTYATHLRLDEELYISAGAAMGVVSYLYRSSTAGTGGSDLAFTGNFGIWLYDDRTRLGLSLNDFPNSRIRPIQEETILQRHLVITAERQIDLHPYFSIRPLAALTWFDRNYYLINAGLHTVIQDRLLAGATFITRKGPMLTCGLQGIDLLSGDLSFYFSYRIALTTYSDHRINTFELSLKYSLPKAASANTK